MPELPEVEIFKQVADSCRGRTINHVSIADPGILDGIPAQGLGTATKGATPAVVATPRQAPLPRAERRRHAGHAFRDERLLKARFGR